MSGDMINLNEPETASREHDQEEKEISVSIVCSGDKQGFSSRFLLIY